MKIVYIVIGKKNVLNVKINQSSEMIVQSLVIDVQENHQFVTIRVYVGIKLHRAKILLTQGTIVQYYVKAFIQIVKSAIDMKYALYVLIEHLLERLVMNRVKDVQEMDSVILVEYVMTK
jgi:hypothetical protein